MGAETHNLLGIGAADVVGHWYPDASLNLYPYDAVKSSSTAGPREPNTTLAICVPQNKTFLA